MSRAQPAIRNRFHDAIVNDLLGQALGGFKQVDIYTIEQVDSRGFPQRHEERKQVIFELFRLEAEHPQRGTFKFLIERLEALYAKVEKEAQYSESFYRSFRQKLEELHLDFCVLEERRFSINPIKLKELYDTAFAQRPLVQRTLVFPGNITESKKEKIIAAMDAIFSQVKGEWFNALSPEERREVVLAVLATIIDIRESSTAIDLLLSPELADDIERAFRENLLPFVADVRTDHSATFAGRHPQFASLSEDPEEHFRRLWRKLSLRERILRPWRRLRWFYSFSVRASPLAHGISQSDERAYASTTPGNRRALYNDLLMSWLLWPCVSIVVSLVLLLPVAASDQKVSIFGGIAAGVLLSIAGGQVCAAVVAPLAAAAGAIVLGSAFALALGVIFGHFADTALLGTGPVQQDTFLAVVGGPLGLTAPHWLGVIPGWLIVVMLTLIAASIAQAGYLMAQPKNADPTIAAARLRLRTGQRAYDHLHVPGAILGSMAGAGIGLTFGVTSLGLWLGLSQVAAFMLGFGLIGGLTFSMLVRRAQGRNWRDAILFGAGFAFVVVCIVYLAAHVAGLPGLVLLAMANAMFQALFFTAAHVVGSLFSARTATVATVLEGAVGFTAFIAARIFS